MHYKHLEEPGWRSRYSNWLRAGRPSARSSSSGGGKNFHFLSSRPALGSTQPPFQWVTGALSRGIKRQGREADHSPPASVEAKKWIYTSTPPYALMALCLIKRRDNFTFFTNISLRTCS
jgi:hypothetical protein